MGELVSRLFDLNGKTIIVAGGSGQIGFTFALALLDAGAHVIIADRDIELAKSKLGKHNLHLEDAQAISFESVDVSQKVAVSKFYKDIIARYGEIYGLVNSFHFKGNSRMLDTASSFFCDFVDYPEEAWDQVHEVNLKGTFLMCQGFIKLGSASSDQVIVNVSSTYGMVSPNKAIYGKSGINSPVAYASSKSAILNLTRYIATHYADQKIRANTLCPGGVFNNQDKGFHNSYIERTPMGRMANENEYQGAILFLMSNASKYMTGANLVVDGGWTAW